jgi:nitrite reductase (NO-forming)
MRESDSTAGAAGTTQTLRRISLAAALLALAALVIGVLGFTQAAAPKADPAVLDQVAESSKVTGQRIGVAPIGAAHTLDAPNVARNPADVPPPITRSEPTTVRVTLTVKELTAEIADGATYAFWTFDGTVPGSMLRVMEGDTVELTLVNPAESRASHNIDLHAVNGPGGGAAVTNVAPGESKTFTFKALNPGIYIYHCAFPPPMHHIAQGMYGAILVEPVGGLPTVDREFYVVQGEWYTTGAFGDQGHQEFSNAKALAEQPEYFTFNGRVDTLTKLHPLQANVGETVRVFFGVGGPNVGSNFHIIGEIFEKVYSGSPDTFTANEETWYTPPGSAAVFELKLDEPGEYLLVDHALYRVTKGAAGVLRAAGEWDTDIYAPPAEGTEY